MRKAALLALLVMLVPAQAQALETDELLGLVAMPLAVAAASEVTGVPVSELSQLVATLNRAQMPPTQVVQVVRYAPAALVVEHQQPAFVDYLDAQVDQGVTGPQLVTVIEDRYRTYDLEPRFVTLEEPATTWVVRDDYIPDVVVTRVAQVTPSYVVGDTNDLLALAAMPLAVAAVAELTGMPAGELSNLVASLNAARLPAVQVVEVLRYSPVVLADEYERPRFVQYVNTQVAGGVTGPRLIEVIDDRYRAYDVEPRFERVAVRDVVRVDDGDDFFPAVVTSRVARVRAHPHGGPPGQVKKELGLQTGAEVVHGAARGSSSRDRKPRATAQRERGEERRIRERAQPRRTERVSARPDRDREMKRAGRPHPNRVKADRQRSAQPRVERERGGGNDGKGRGKANGNGNGNGKGKGKG